MFARNSEMARECESPEVENKVTLLRQKMFLNFFNRPENIIKSSRLNHKCRVSVISEANGLKKIFKFLIRHSIVKQFGSFKVFLQIQS